MWLDRRRPRRQRRIEGGHHLHPPRDRIGDAGVAKLPPGKNARLEMSESVLDMSETGLDT